MTTSFRYFQILIALLVLSGVTIPLSSQDRVCNTETGKEFHEYYDNLVNQVTKLKSSETDDSWINVPISLQLETKGGIPAIEELDVNKHLDTVNSWYAPGKIKFFICGNITYYNEGTTPETNLRTPNIRFYKSSQGCGATYGDRVGINVDCARTIPVILGHELGHVLGLGHTHGFNTGTTDELVDGSNCDEAGDGFCDTPADPGLSGNVNSSCQYTGGLKDDNGDAYQPATNNLMSYSEDKCMNHLTNEQFQRARTIAVAKDFTCCLLDAPMASGTDVCNGDKATLSATASAPEIRWYDAEKDGTLLHTGSNFTTEALTSTTIFYAEAYDTCGSGRTEVLVEVNPPSKPTTAVAELFADLDSTAGSYPLSFTKFEKELYVIANNNEIWKTNGDYGNIAKIATLGTNVTSLTLLGDKLLIAVNTNTSPELWSSNGTASGTKRIKYFGDTYGYSNFDLVTKEKDTAYMVLNAPGEVAEIWKSDGTASGTEKVKTLSINAFTGLQLTPVGDKVFFLNSDTNGKELWITNGSESVTYRLKDILPGTESSNPDNLVNSKGFLYFTAIDTTTNRGLWVSDGTSTGTRKLTDLELPNWGVGLTDINGSLYFSGIHPSWGEEPYMSDGTGEGTRAVADINPSDGSSPGNFFAYKDEVYFIADDGTNGSELWKLDPNSTTGAVMVKNINPSSGSGITEITVDNGLIYFRANDGYSDPNHGPELWSSDGTEQGTVILADIVPGTSGSLPGDFTFFNNTLFFRATGNEGSELWYLNDQDLHVCKGNSITIKTGNPVGEINWYDAKTNGSLLHTGSEFTTPNINNTTSYFADLTHKGCTSERVEIKVELINTDPTVPNDTIVKGETTTLSVNSEGTVKWYNNASEDILLHTGDDFSTGTLSNDTSFYVKIDYGSCMSNLTEAKVIVLPKYSLTVENGSGSEEYTEGDEVTIQSDAPPADHVFDTWTGDTVYLDDPSSSAAILTMPAKDITITATYREAEKDLITLTVNNGSGSGTYEIESKVQIIANTPEDGYVFSHWSGDTTGILDIEKEKTFILLQNEDQTINAEYEVKTHVDSKITSYEIDIYPIPADDIINIRSSSSLEQINIYTLQGKLVIQNEFNMKEGQLDVSILDNGLYLLEIVSTNGSRTITKVIKQ